jgi:L-ascorbate metabolism protein UlaG (beta-lactamase superfamily)
MMDGKAGSSLRLQRLGWAGVKIELGEGALVIDPLVNPEHWGGAFRHLVCPIECSISNRHALVTHLHSDHFDAGSIEGFVGKGGEVICFERVAVTVAARGFRVRPLRLWEPLVVGALTVAPVPASDGFGIDQVSWVVGGAGKRILHGGDTLWHGAWWDIGKQLGPFDAVCLPVNGFRYSPRDPDIDVPSSLTPEQAVEAAYVLGAKRLVPIHYGLSAPFYREEEDIVGRLQARAALRGIGLELLKPGDWLPG